MLWCGKNQSEKTQGEVKFRGAESPLACIALSSSPRHTGTWRLFSETLTWKVLGFALIREAFPLEQWFLNFSMPAAYTLLWCAMASYFTWGRQHLVQCLAHSQPLISIFGTVC